MERILFLSLLLLLAGSSYATELTESSESEDGLHPHHRALVSSVSSFGSCKTPAIRINAGSVSEIMARKSHSNATLAIVTITKDIKLTTSLNLTSAFTCTIFISNNHTISYPNYDTPAVIVDYVTNMLFYQVNFAIYTSVRQTTSVTPACVGLPIGKDNAACPALLIHRSYNVQLTHAVVHGRVDVHTCAAVTVDHCTVIAYANLQDFLHFNATNVANIRVQSSGSNVGLIRSAIEITNNYLLGTTFYGVYLVNNAVGVSVANNLITNVSFGGVICGCCFHAYGDCMLNTISNNEVYMLTLTEFVYSDSGGLYLNTKWTNPGNYISCNYVYGASSCIYLDDGSSGVTIDGGVCHSCGITLKLNGGKANVISSLISYESYHNAAFISCLIVCEWNCNAGQFYNQSDILVLDWVYYINNYFNSTAWKMSFPWTLNICNYTSILGVPCNPPGKVGSQCSVAVYCEPNENCFPPYDTIPITNCTEGAPVATAAQTGACSGLAYLNYGSLIGIDYTNNFLAYQGSCQVFPAVTNLNYLVAYSFTSKTVGFDNIAAANFGVSNLNSPIYTLYPGFKSCSRAAIGPQSIPDQAAAAAKYASKLNSRGAPRWFRHFVNLPKQQIEEDPGECMRKKYRRERRGQGIEPVAGIV